MAFIGRGRGIKKKEEKREDHAFLFIQLIHVKLHPDHLLQVPFLFGEQGALDFELVVTEPSSRQAISDEISSSAMAEC